MPFPTRGRARKYPPNTGKFYNVTLPSNMVGKQTDGARGKRDVIRNL